MKLRMPDSVASSQDINSIIIEVHEYAKWFNHESIKASVSAGHKSEPPVMSPITMQILREWEVKNPISQHSLDQLAEVLKDYIKNSPSITITLAAPPTGSIKASLVKWCRSNISSNILVDFQFNSTLMGGMVVRYGSRIFDWSFRRQLLTARSNFPEVLRHV
ncbi:hypothetical protein CVV43_00180 [Candidatus Saccharibacteria bacterium HGW-Saccharibacteria-1]|nr:MAG: hypothetical protein CVV43_00180 [Candidatus Saccharibacteria bacterium HGW-Saccharibacteria-1]